MRNYAKLAVFIAVLLFSVSLMSVAIDYLGDISDIDLDMQPQPHPTRPVQGVEQPSEEKPVQPLSGAGGMPFTPLFEVFYSPRTKYLRWKVGEAYDAGDWALFEGHTPSIYTSKDEIDLDVSGSTSPEVVSIGIHPLFNITGFMPVALSTIQIELKADVQHYPELELFSVLEPIGYRYNLTYYLYDFSRETLLGADTRHVEGYDEVPAELENRLVELANEIVSSWMTDWEKLNALEVYLKEHYEYNRDVESPPEEVDPIEQFLFNGTGGTCSHFNSAFVLLARSIGLPARVVIGFYMDPEMEYQIVTPKNAHLWAEVPFENLGWITFDATPENITEGPMEDPRPQTITKIVYNDETALKGGTFIVNGTVTTLNGTAVDGMDVEIFLKFEKEAEEGIRCGEGVVRGGVFKITCNADPSLDVGDYQLQAHSIENDQYMESWSDPPITIMAETEVAITAQSEAHIGQSVLFTGVLLDKSNSEPIPNATLKIIIKGNPIWLTTNAEGKVSVTRSFDKEGNETVNIQMDDTRFYIGSNSSFGVAITAQPPGILEMLTMFPYNIMLIAGAVVAIGAVVMFSRRGTKAPAVKVAPTATPVVEEVYEDDQPLQFKDYKEGVVKLFNRYFRSVARRYNDIDESMTPREFQQALLKKIPTNGASALEYLVTAFEIADYSLSKPTKEMYDKCTTAVELLKGMMGSE
jgi:transglutaminase-like putative cysteine protease